MIELGVPLKREMEYAGILEIDILGW